MWKNSLDILPVIPVRNPRSPFPCATETGAITGVLDVDSSQYENFDETDAAELTRIIALVHTSKEETLALRESLLVRK